MSLKENNSKLETALERKEKQHNEQILGLNARVDLLTQTLQLLVQAPLEY